MSWLAEDLMTPNVVCVLADMDVRDLSKLFVERGITGAPVTARDGAIRGVVSQTDLLRYAISRGDELVMESDFYGTARIEGRYLPRGFQIEDANTATVADIMTPVVHSVSEKTPAEDIARMMRGKHIHRAIVEKEGKVVGIVSALDLIAVLSTPRRAGASRTRKK